MKLKLEKFGTLLLSRETGREALKAFQSVLRDLPEREVLEIDFSGVLTFSPSWGDEFLSPLLDRFGNDLVLLKSDNMSVLATIKLLQEIKKKNFVIREE